VSVAVLVSLFVSFTLTPMLSARLLKVSHGKKFILSRAIERMLDAVDHVYRRTLGFVLRSFWSKLGTFVLAVVVLIGSCGLSTRVKQEMLPAEDHSQMSIDMELPVGTSLAFTSDDGERIAADVRAQVPGVDNTYLQV